MAELAPQPPPAGWVPLSTLIKRSGLPERAVSRHLLSKKVPMKKFRILTDQNQIRSVIHFYMGK
jgi:hypothetical protein